MATATYTFKVDWNNDGDYSDSGEDISSFVLQAEWSYGRDYASQLTGRSTAGICMLLVKNSDGRFNSFNSSSPLTGNLLPARKLRIQMTEGGNTTTMWVGFLDSIEPLPEIGGIHKATLRFIGPLGYIAQRKVNIPMATYVFTGTQINAVLDEIGWPAADRSINAGKMKMDRHWTGGKVTALFALRDLEETEPGFIREGKAGQIVFEDRHDRLTSPKTVSQATFSDAPGAALKYTQIVQQDPLREIFNIIEAEVREHTVGASVTLWTHPEANTSGTAPLLGTEDITKTKVFWANYPNPQSATNAVAVNAWTTPVATTDYQAFANNDGTGADLTANITLSVNKLDNAMKITLTNTGSQAAYLTKLQARGTPVTVNDPVKIVAEDSTSKTKYGERTYPVPGRFIPSTDEADSYVRYVLSNYKDIIPVLQNSYSANRSSAHLTEARTRDVSDRITITANNSSDLGINSDFFVERITHRVTDGGLNHNVNYECSPAYAYGAGFFTIGVSVLQESTKIAY